MLAVHSSAGRNVTFQSWYGDSFSVTTRKSPSSPFQHGSGIRKNGRTDPPLVRAATSRLSSAQRASCAALSRAIRASIDSLVGTKFDSSSGFIADGAQELAGLAFPQLVGKYLLAGLRRARQRCQLRRGLLRPRLRRCRLRG